LPCWAEGGQIDQNQIEFAALKEPLRYRVFTPPCYQQQPQRRYPVLYLLHGQTYTDDQWDRLGADESASALIGAGEISPLIIVMPYEADDRLPPTESSFGEALVEALIPYIDARYRTLPSREQRAIGGLSRGGNWAVRLGLSHWELFGAIGAHSTPTFVTDGPPQIRAWLQSIPYEQRPRIYLDTGENDRWGTYTFKLETVLNEEGVPHEWHLYPGYHTEEYWAAHVEEYLRWYAREW
jgi:enterochelin esterase-like enzyme